MCNTWGMQVAEKPLYTISLEARDKNSSSKGPGKGSTKGDQHRISLSALLQRSRWVFLPGNLQSYLPAGYVCAR